MFIKLSVTLFLALSILIWPAAAQNPPQPPDQSQEQIGYKSASDAEQKKTLLLKDFHPNAMLHAPEHKVDRAKFYVIDVHNHTNDAMGIDDHMPPARVVEIMDKTNVKTVVILTGMWGAVFTVNAGLAAVAFPGARGRSRPGAEGRA